MQISSLAEAGGVSARTVRFYEQRGLIAPPPRTRGGYRDYPPAAVQRLRFIRDAQAAGLRLADIQGILALRDSGQAPCALVEEVIAEHLNQIEQSLTDLHTTRSALRDLARRASEANPEHCAEPDICTILARPPKTRKRLVGE